MTLTEQTILLQAPNPAAAENGRKLWKKGSFSALHRTEDGTLYWAECAGPEKVQTQDLELFVVLYQLRPVHFYNIKASPENLFLLSV